MHLKDSIHCLKSYNNPILKCCLICLKMLWFIADPCGCTDICPIFHKHPLYVPFHHKGRHFPDHAHAVLGLEGTISEKQAQKGNLQWGSGLFSFAFLKWGWGCNIKQFALLKRPYYKTESNEITHIQQEKCNSPVVSLNNISVAHLHYCSRRWWK